MPRRPDPLLQLAVTAEARYGSVIGHVDRVGRYCEVIAAGVGLRPARAQMVGSAVRLHDFGKLALPDGILLKPSALTPGERGVVELHAVIGYQLLAGSSSRLLELAAVIALRHHERWDGKGYPGGLCGRSIPIAARIASVADVFDSLTRDRPYRAALPHGQALEMIRAGGGTQFDPEVVEVFFARQREIREAANASSKLHSLGVVQ